MGSSLLNISVTGLAAAQAGLLVTGHNIANAATPGYSRQGTVQSTNVPQFTGAGYFGQGTNVVTVKRIYSQFLIDQVASARTRAAELETYSRELAQITDMLADPSAGLSPALQDFFKAVQEVSAYPASIPARQAMLSSGQALVARFHGLENRFQEIRDGINSQLITETTTIGSIAQQIAELNQRVALAEGSVGGQPPNDLLDQRDQLLAELNEHIRVTTTQDSDGSYNVFVGNGQPLVIGALASRLEAVQDELDPTRLRVAMELPTGGTLKLLESLLTGGSLGGLLAFRSESLDPAHNALGRLAIGFAETFNDAHRLGQDLSGALGGDFYVAPTARAFASSANTGGAVLQATIADATALTTSDYRVTALGGGNFSIARVADGAILLASGTLPQSLDGVTISLASGSANAGDTFLVQPTRIGARDLSVAIADPRAIAAAGPLRTAAALANAGTARIGAGANASVTGLAPGVPHIHPPVTLTFDAAASQFVLSGGLAGTLAYDPATESVGKVFTLAAIGDFSFQIAGVPSDGDAFTISSNDLGTADNRNALALGQLQSAPLLIGGTATYQSTYSQLVSEIGNKGREVEVTLAAQENLSRQALDAQAALSGVNLDEEAANLLRYQQAYQAAGKVIELSGKLFEELLAAVN